MIKEELYNRTVNILFDAYFNDTLVHSNCYACAVGNIVAANMGFEMERRSAEVDYEGHLLSWKGYPNSYLRGDQAEGYPTWFDAISGNSYRPDRIHGKIKEQIDSTGYAPQQLANIEWAFEKVKIRAKENTSPEELMYNGLVAVLEVLDHIHEVNTEVSQQSKSRFTNHYETLTA